ncbi:16S rRNA (cytidine(1402)-2'-O)-methyltransferase [Mycoplasmopsis edwardii]|nr:16S rRNA (cytidine(1402)-2'-O)-methyltransferase [Mycoplasmopsis edwardii]
MSKIYIVGTPIGNLHDITLRALETLRTADIIACEDTRVTKKLLDKYQIKDKRLITYNAFTELYTAKELVDIVEDLKLKVAVVSDAGMPVVSDPGFGIINLARERGIEVEIIPGVSASITAFTGANFSSQFTFLGFIKDKTEQRKNDLKQSIVLQNHTYIYFVSPHKLLGTLEDIHEVFGDEIKVCLAKELTKIHEEWLFDSPSKLIEQFKSKQSIKGEFTMCLMIPKVKREKINKYEKFSKIKEMIEAS